MNVESGKELARVVSDFSNTSSTQDLIDFAEELTNGTHRTLQQTCMVMFVECLKRWEKAYNDGYYDARNEATVLAAKKMLAALGDDNYFPFI